jgi:hypothetical protein
MAYLGSAIAWIAGIVVLVKLFQKEGFLKGILGFICMIYTYIWGWMHVKDETLNIKTWMWIWTGAILLGIVLNVIGSAQSVTSNIIQGLGG